MRQGDGGRQARPGSVNPAEHGAQAGDVVGRPGIGVLEIHRLVGPAGEHVIAARGVRIVTRGHAAQNAELIGNERRARQQLGNRHAGDRRRDRSELTADLGRGIRLGVPRRMLGRAPHQKEDDARPSPPERRACRRISGGLGARSHQLGQAQPRPETAQAADPHHLTAVPAITEASTRSEQPQHQNLSDRTRSMKNRCSTKGTLAILRAEIKDLREQDHTRETKAEQGVVNQSTVATGLGKGRSEQQSGRCDQQTPHPGAEHARSCGSRLHRGTSHG